MIASFVNLNYILWWEKMDLNHRHTAYKADALTSELFSQRGQPLLAVSVEVCQKRRVFPMMYYTP